MKYLSKVMAFIATFLFTHIKKVYISRFYDWSKVLAQMFFFLCSKDTCVSALYFIIYNIQKYVISWKKYNSVYTYSKIDG